MRFASRCQPACAFCGHACGAVRAATRCGAAASPQPTASSTTTTATTPSAFTAQLKPVNRDPWARAIFSGRDVVDPPRPHAQVVVETRLARIPAAGRKHAIRHRPGNDHEPDPVAAQLPEVAVRIRGP